MPGPLAGNQRLDKTSFADCRNDLRPWGRRLRHHGPAWGAFAGDEGGDLPDRAEVLHGHVAVLDLDAELALKGNHHPQYLQGVEDLEQVVVVPQRLVVRLRQE